MKALLFVLASAVVLKAYAVNTQALQYIPGGEIVQHKVKEVKVKTPNGSIVEVEFNGDGTLEEASGKILKKIFSSLVFHL